MMRSLLNRTNCRRIVLAFIGAAIMILGPRTDFSAAQNPNFVVPSHHPTGHVHGHSNQSWPPQPNGITDVIDFSNPDMAVQHKQKVQERFSWLEQFAGSRNDFRAALGRRYKRIEVVEEVRKQGLSPGSRFLYFSHDNNATVAVEFDGNSIQSVKSIPPNEYQPDPSAEEIEEATQLARTHILGMGVARVQDLKGYGILAYHTVGRGFYASRVIYISFHSNDDAPPEVEAWVDLSREKILAV